MYKVLFKLEDINDIEHVKSIMMANHKDNGDILIFSDVDVDADITILVPQVKKRRAIILDHSGTVHRLGYPDSIEYDSLLSDKDGMEKAERIIKEIERIEKLPKECPSCKFMKPAGMHECSKCGFMPRMGEDVDVDRTRELVALNKKLEKPVTQADKQRFYSELIGFWNEKKRDGKNWSQGWYAHMYKAKFGVWPRSLADLSLDPSKETRNFITSQFIRNAKRRAA